MIKTISIAVGILSPLLIFADNKIQELNPVGGEPNVARIEKWDETIVVNSAFAQIPLITIKDNCDFKKYSGQSAKGIKINGKPVWDKLLSQGEVTFKPDGSAIWHYQAGIGKVDRNAVNTNKFILKTQYDALPAGRKWKYIYIQNGTYCLRYPGNPPLTFPLPTPSDRELQSIECKVAAASFHKEDSLIVKLTSDPTGKDVIAEKELQRKDIAKAIIFSGELKTAKYISLMGKAPKGGLILPSRWLIKASYSPVQIISPLAKGKNQIKFTSSKDGSPYLKVSYTLNDAPFVEDFDDPKWQEPPYLPSKGTSFQGENHLSMIMPGGIVLRPTGGKQYFDFSGFSHLQVALRCKSGKNGFIYLYLYYDDPKTGKPKNSGFRRMVTSHNIKKWSIRTANIANISDEAKKRIKKIRLRSVGNWRYGKQNVEIDALSILKFVPEKQANDEEQFRRKFKKIAKEKLNRAKQIEFKVPKTIPDVKNGVYFGAFMGAPRNVKKWTGFSEEDSWRVVFQDQIDLGFNTVLLTNYTGPGREKFDQVLSTAESMGLRLWYQGPHFWRYKGTLKRSIAYYEKNVKPSIEKQLPKYANRWGLLAWEPSEEEPPAFVDAVKPQFELMRKIDPQHPPVIIWNNKQSVWAMAKKIRPKVQSFDIYPFFGGYTPELEVRYMLGLLKNFTEAARAGNSIAWIVMQSYANPASGGDNFYWGRRIQTPADVKLQMWLAAALGCRGFFFYPYQCMRNSVEFVKKQLKSSYCQLSPPFFNETPFRNAVRETVAKFKRLEPFLVEGKFVKELNNTGNKKLFACHYKFKNTDCLRIVNTDRKRKQRLDKNLLPEIKNPWYRDMLSGKITQNLQDLNSIQPGEGLMIAVSADKNKLILTK